MSKCVYNSGVFDFWWGGGGGMCVCREGGGRGGKRGGGGVPSAISPYSCRPQTRSTGLVIYKAPTLTGILRPLIYEHEHQMFLTCLARVAPGVRVPVLIPRVWLYAEIKTDAVVLESMGLGGRHLAEFNTNHIRQALTRH